MDPFGILLIGLGTVIGAIALLRLHPFLALILAAVAVSFASPIPADLTVDAAGVADAASAWNERLLRVAEAFGVMAGKISFLIVFGAIIGACLTESGAAKRIVLVLCRLFGIKRVPAALLASGFFLSIPVFYDVTFYLLLPLAKTVYRMTGRRYVLYLLAIGFGATLSHTLVPPTPGPLVVAGEMGVSLGAMMLVGAMVGLCTIPAALLIAAIIDRRNPNPAMSETGEEPEISPTNLAKNSNTANTAENVPPLAMTQLTSDSGIADSDEKLPSLALAILPLVIPVVLIAGRAILESCPTKLGASSETLLVLRNVLALAGDAQVALFLAAILAAAVMVEVRKMGRHGVEKVIGLAIHSAGTIILITSAGGAFGAMLRLSGIGERITQLASGANLTSGPFYLLLAFGVAALIKTAQGSSTTAMITTAAIISTLGADALTLGFHPAYLASAIGAGAIVTGWMNDSGFCIFAGMSGLTEAAALKTWTVGLVFLGLSALAAILVLSTVVPLI